MGRPSDYSQEIAEAIFLEIATTDKGLEAICEPDEFPSPRTVYTWLVRHEEFSQMYTRAKELQTQLLADQIIPIADTPMIGVKTVDKPTGLETTTGDMLEHRKLQIEGRKWLLAKLQPRKYGDRTTIAGDKDNPLEVEVTDARSKLAARLSRGTTKPS